MSQLLGECWMLGSLTLLPYSSTTPTTAPKIRTRTPTRRMNLMWTVCLRSSPTWWAWPCGRCTRASQSFCCSIFSLPWWTPPIQEFGRSGKRLKREEIIHSFIIILKVGSLKLFWSPSFFKVILSSDIQWKYSKSFYEIQYLCPRAVLPSPFRVIFYIVKCLYHQRNATCGSSRKDQHQRYCHKLREIVKSKIHFDFENSIQDDFSDMKQDIQNFVSEKQKETIDEINNLKQIIETVMMAQSQANPKD